jgi:hypothetical protein
MDDGRERREGAGGRKSFGRDMQQDCDRRAGRSRSPRGGRGGIVDGRERREGEGGGGGVGGGGRGGHSRNGGPSRNALLNKSIMDCRSEGEVCKLIEGRAAEFNHVATAFRKVLTEPARSGSSGVVDGALQMLETAALRLIDDFEAQHIANILHIMAKARYHPRDQSLVPTLEGRVEALACTFNALNVHANAQNVANTLWAIATMGREPRVGMMRELEGHAEALARTFKEQNVANTLWAYATMGRVPGARMMRELEGRAEATAGTFIAQAIANTLWAYATMGREPGARLMMEQEGRADATAGTFIAQERANTLWAYATMGREPGARLMREQEGRAEVIVGKFNAIDVSNTLWAYATMYLDPGEGVMKELEVRAEAVAATFKAREVLNTLWAYATMCPVTRHAVTGCGNPGRD